MEPPPAKKPHVVLSVDEHTALAAVMMSFGLNRDEIGRVFIALDPLLSPDQQLAVTLKRLGLPKVAIEMVIDRVKRSETVIFRVHYRWSETFEMRVSLDASIRDAVEAAIENAVERVKRRLPGTAETVDRNLHRIYVDALPEWVERPISTTDFTDTIYFNGSYSSARVDPDAKIFAYLEEKYGKRTEGEITPL